MFRKSIAYVLVLAALAVPNRVAAAPRVNAAGSLEIAPDRNEGETTFFVVEGEAAPASVQAGAGTSEPSAPVTGATRSAGNSPPKPAAKGQHLILSGTLASETDATPLRGALAFDPTEFDLEPGGRQPVTVRASSIFFEGAAQAIILSYGEKVGSLRVHRAPFAVSLVEQAVALREGGTGTLTLRNDTQYPLELRWRLQLGGVQLCGPALRAQSAPQNANASTQPAAETQPAAAHGPFACAAADASTASPALPTLSIAPLSRAVLELEAPAGDVAWFDQISTRTEPAVLWLSANKGPPRRDMTFQAHIEGRYFPGETIWVVGFLILGAFISLMVRHWVPNLQRKRVLKAQLRQVELKVDDFSGEIRSQLREQTRSECEILHLRLSSRWTLMPDYASIVDECTPLIAILDRRVTLIERIDTAWSRLADFWDTTPPPTQVDEIENLLGQASDGLTKFQPSGGELDAIEKLIDRALDWAREYGGTNTEGADTFGQELAKRAQAALAGAKTLEPAAKKYGFTSLFESIKTLAPQGPTPLSGNAAPAVELPREDWGKLDYCLRALDVWKEFVWLYPCSTQPSTAEPTGAVLESLAAHLRRYSWSELRLARRMLKEIRENSDGDDVKAAVEAQPPRMFIDFEPKRIVYPQVVNFRIRFLRDDLNWSAARDHVVPAWSFQTPSPEPQPEQPDPDPFAERGCWEVSHMFMDQRRWWQRLADWASRNLLFQSKTGEESIQVKFRCRGEGTPLQGVLKATVTVDKAGLGERRHRLFTEVLALLVSIGVPLLSLIAGAKEKLAEDPGSGALVVFLLGFSSDTVVSALRQRVGGSGNG